MLDLKKVKAVKSIDKNVAKLIKRKQAYNAGNGNINMTYEFKYAINSLGVKCQQ